MIYLQTQSILSSLSRYSPAQTRSPAVSPLRNCFESARLQLLHRQARSIFVTHAGQKRYREEKTVRVRISTTDANERSSRLSLRDKAGCAADSRHLIATCRIFLFRRGRGLRTSPAPLQSVHGSGKDHGVDEHVNNPEEHENNR